MLRWWGYSWKPPPGSETPGVQVGTEEEEVAVGSSRAGCAATARETAPAFGWVPTMAGQRQEGRSRREGGRQL